MQMIRRLIAVALAALFVGNATAQDAKLKIATVDMQQLFKEYYKTNEAQQQINVERAKIQKDNNEKLTAIRQIESDIQVIKQQLDDPTISDAKKQESYKAHQGKYQEGIQLDKERREYLTRKNQALNEKMVQRMRGILGEIQKLVEERAKAENYDYVFDKSGMSTSQVPFLLYTKDAIDVTATLLKDLNKDAPAESTPAPAPAPAQETPTTRSPAKAKAIYPPLERPLVPPVGKGMPEKPSIVRRRLMAAIFSTDGRSKSPQRQVEAQFLMSDYNAKYKRRMLNEMRQTLLSTPIPEDNGSRIGGGRVLPLYESERLIRKMELRDNTTLAQWQWPNPSVFNKRGMTPSASAVSLSRPSSTYFTEFMGRGDVVPTPSRPKTALEAAFTLQTSASAAAF